MNKTYRNFLFFVLSFCEKAKISQSPVRNAVNFGIIPSVLILLRIANYFNTSFDYLIGESENDNFIESVTPSTFHERYELLKTERNVKDSQIANVMPFARNVISEWKRNKTIPSLDYLKCLANYFIVSIDYLLGRTDFRT